MNNCQTCRNYGTHLAIRACWLLPSKPVEKKPTDGCKKHAPMKANTCAKCGRENELGKPCPRCALWAKNFIKENKGKAIIKTAKTIDENGFLRYLDQYLVNRDFRSFPQNSRTRHKGSRYKPGTPDIIARTPAGQFVMFECKMPGGRLSEAQEDMRETMGPCYFVVTPENYVDVVDMVLKIDKQEVPF